MSLHERMSSNGPARLVAAKKQGAYAPRLTLISRTLLGLFVLSSPASAQLPPGRDGYAFPAGGKVGTAVEVRLGGADWTPDVQFFVHNPRVKLQVLSKPGPVLMHDPPYWFGVRSFANDPRLPREVSARLILPADLPPGPIPWSVANASGGGSGGVFLAGTGNELTEDESRRGPQELPALPVTVSGRLRRIEEVDRYRFQATQGGPVTCDLLARRLGSEFHGVLEISDADGNRVADVIDTEGRDPTLTFRAEKGKSYTVAVRDLDHAGFRNYTYRLLLREGTDRRPEDPARPAPRFQLRTSGIVNVPIGGKASMAVNIVRAAGFKEPVTLAVVGLPAGLTVPPNLVLAPTAQSLAIPFDCARDAAATASLVQFTGTAKAGENTLTEIVRGELRGDISAREADANLVPNVLVVTTLKPPFKVKAVEADGGRRIPRGSTHLTEILLERTDGFTGEIVLDMAGAQQRHRQGIRGPALTVAAGQSKVNYPVFVPEWLETTRTSRLGLIAMARVPDPKGTPRYVMAAMEGQITMSIEGALMKLSPGPDEITATPGTPFSVALHLARSPKLTEAVTVELIVPEELQGLVTAQPLRWPTKQSSATWTIDTRRDARLVGTWQLTARASTLRDGHPVVSETPFEVEFTNAPQAAAAP